MIMRQVLIISNLIKQILLIFCENKKKNIYLCTFCKVCPIDCFAKKIKKNNASMEENDKYKFQAITFKKTLENDDTKYK